MKFRLFIAAAMFAAGVASAADWPQWRGPNRDGYSAETGLMKTWPKSGPKLLWTCKEAGIGYGQPAIVGDILYLTGAEEAKDGEFVSAHELANGKQKWKTPIPIIEKIKGFNTNWGGGPRCTPTVDGDRLYVLGAQGDLACLETATGKIIWHKSMTKDLGGKAMAMWGYCESPIVEGDLLICSPGYGRSGKGGMQALDKKTGEVKWVCKDMADEAAYSSIVITKVGNVRVCVQLTPKGAYGVDAKSGKLLWSVPKVAANDTAVIPTPVVSGDWVYVTSNYPSGNCALIKLTADGDGVKAEKIYSNANLKNHHGGVVLVDGHIYGANGNANRQKTIPFVCQNFKTGEIVWKEESMEPSSVTYADGALFCYGQNTGVLVKVEPTPKGFHELGRFKIPQTSDIRESAGGIWTHPVIADGKLFLRDQDLLFCYDLKAR